jgi:hypothetical protein
LPSAYGGEQCDHLGITSLAEKELILHQGQANNAFCTSFGLTWDIIPIYIALRSDMLITANKEKSGCGTMFIP